MTTNIKDWPDRFRQVGGGRSVSYVIVYYGMVYHII